MHKRGNCPAWPCMHFCLQRGPHPDNPPPPTPPHPHPHSTHTHTRRLLSSLSLQAAFECMDELLDRCYDRVDAAAFIAHLESGLKVGLSRVVA